MKFPKKNQTHQNCRQTISEAEKSSQEKRQTALKKERKKTNR